MRQGIVPLMIVAAAMAVCAVGCGERAASIPEGMYRLTVEDIARDKGMMVRRIVIEAAGGRTVTVMEGKDRSEAMVSADAATGRMRAEIILVADLTEVGEQKAVRWLVQVKHGSGWAGGSVTAPTEANRLADLFDWRVSDGAYPLATELELGSFRETPIVLTVK